MLVVVDTNVWVVASGYCEQADNDCELNCLQLIISLEADNFLIIDYQNQIINEYYNNIRENSVACQILNKLLRIGKIEFASAVDDLPSALDLFDESDKKFAAVALSFSPPAPIYNAVDSDWQQFSAAIAAFGLTVNELCPQCLT
jgi:hypothetical protein